MSLSGRVALVTGASQGIGKACVLKLAERGATVAVVARNEEKLKELVSHISGTGGKSAAFPMDVADEEQIKNTCKTVIAEFGKIDILVNNAGITRDQLVMRMKRADWDAVINTNLTSAYLCTQQVISAMLRQRWGRIINITSIFGQIGQTGQANYASSKAGLIGLTMAIAREVASRNITCNAVAPGFIETAMTECGSISCFRGSVLYYGSCTECEWGDAHGVAHAIPRLTIAPAKTPAQIAQVRELFLEYASSLGFSLCFQNFDQELAGLPGDYAPPDGRLMLALYEGELAGCVALHKLDSEICEMKRLYLRPKFRGKGLGPVLAENIIGEARRIGYRRMRLDTVEPVMKDAVAMYRRLGFKEIAPYRPNPMPGTLYMELEL